MSAAPAAPPPSPPPPPPPPLHGVLAANSGCSFCATTNSITTLYLRLLLCVQNCWIIHPLVSSPARAALCSTSTHMHTPTNTHIHTHTHTKASLSTHAHTHKHIHINTQRPHRQHMHTSVLELYISPWVLHEYTLNHIIVLELYLSPWVLHEYTLSSTHAPGLSPSIHAGLVVNANGPMASLAAPAPAITAAPPANAAPAITAATIAAPGAGSVLQRAAYSSAQHDVIR